MSHTRVTGTKHFTSFALASAIAAVLVCGMFFSCATVGPEAVNTVPPAPAEPKAVPQEPLASVPQKAAPPEPQASLPASESAAEPGAKPAENIALVTPEDELPPPLPVPSRPAAPKPASPPVRPEPAEPVSLSIRPQPVTPAPPLPPEEALSPLLPGLREPSRSIASPGVKTAASLAAFFLAHNPAANAYQVGRLAEYYIDEGTKEGVNSDLAFTQMCLETGFLRFGGLVTADMHNYCGLGAIDEGRPGESFPSEELGVRAHIQHLQAYGLTTPLRAPLVDPRYKYVQPRGKARDVWQLAGAWASDISYGEKLDALLSRLAGY